MGKDTGFLEWPRRLPVRRDKTRRLGDWKEIYDTRDEELSREQAGRCMDCGVPFCQQGCPLGNQIPDWNELVYSGQWRAAYDRLTTTNNFPEFTGRICPAPCEPACTLSINTPAVTIEQNELEIIEHAFREGWVEARVPRGRTGKRVAVVGSGPAGLAAAAQLNQVGHSVKVFEAADRLGGLLRYGIPDFKLEKRFVDRRVDILRAEGIEFETGANVGTDPTWSNLQQAYDAVLIAIGAGRARDLVVPGRELSGVHFAIDFLTRQNKLVAGDPDSDPKLDAAGKRVIVLGGGDTGSDCIGTSLRQGAKSVHSLELMPSPPVDRSPGNPWPQWPLVFRTSSSHEEGGSRDFALLTKRLTGQGRLERLHAVRVNVERSSTGGLRFDELPGTTIEMEADMLLLAMGFVSPATDRIVDQLGASLDARGNLATDDSFATSVPGVFAAGDANRGQSLVVWAISEGREAARAIDSHLRDSDAPLLPTRGVDQPYGGR